MVNMIQLGKIQRLKVKRKTSIGVYLNSPKSRETDDDVLLPLKQVPAGTDVGDEIEVFVYKDSEDRLISTTKTPLITVGKVAALRVADVTKIGAFLDWGLEKDLFLPFKEQRIEVQKGGKYLVTLYVDKSNRLSATMDIYAALATNSPYKENDTVHGTVYSISKNLGVFLAIDDKYHGLIPNKELYGRFSIGDEVEARVKKVNPDGKLELATRKQAHNEIGSDAKRILEKLKSENGFMSLNDNSDPNEIKDTLNMSKAAFKRAVGRLLKEKEVVITARGIKLLNQKPSK